MAKTTSNTPSQGNGIMNEGKTIPIPTPQTYSEKRGLSIPLPTPQPSQNIQTNPSPPKISEK